MSSTLQEAPLRGPRRRRPSRVCSPDCTWQMGLQAATPLQLMASALPPDPHDSLMLGCGRQTREAACSLTTLPCCSRCWYAGRDPARRSLARSRRAGPGLLPSHNQMAAGSILQTANFQSRHVLQYRSSSPAPLSEFIQQGRSFGGREAWPSNASALLRNGSIVREPA